MKHTIDIGQVAMNYQQQCQALNIKVADVTRISLDAYAAFYNRKALPRMRKSAVTYDRDDFAFYIWKGIDAAFRTYDPTKGTKFTTHLYNKVTYGLLDALKEMLKQTPAHIDIAADEAKLIPSGYYVVESVCRDDGLDQLGQYLWINNEPQLFMLLPLITLGYSNREMASFMMVNEKTIRNWLSQLMIHAIVFNQKDKCQTNISILKINSR